MKLCYYFRNHKVYIILLVRYTYFAAKPVAQPQQSFCGNLFWYFYPLAERRPALTFLSQVFHRIQWGSREFPLQLNVMRTKTVWGLDGAAIWQHFLAMTILEYYTSNMATLCGNEDIWTLHLLYGNTCGIWRYKNTTAAIWQYLVAKMLEF